jgi:RNA polymerase sigma factor (sigma-70 family)
MKAMKGGGGIGDSVLEQAFLDLLNEHQGALHRIARAYASTAADRQDLVQEIVYQLWRSYPGYRQESASITWVYRVALNTAITSLRRRDRRPVHVSIDHETTAWSLSSPERPDLETLYGAIQRLGDADRALVMCYLDELSYRQIASILGISESNVGARLTRVRAKLQRLVAPKE